MMQHIQYETLRAAHWTGCVWPLYHDVLQTVLCIALPEKKNSLVWAQAFLLLRQYVERGRESKKNYVWGTPSGINN